MKEPYRWDYTVRIKTKDGTFEYEKETLENIDLLLAKHPNYTEIQATHNKPKTLSKKRINDNVQSRNKN